MALLCPRCGAVYVISSAQTFSPAGLPLKCLAQLEKGLHHSWVQEGVHWGAPFLHARLQAQVFTMPCGYHNCYLFTKSNCWHKHLFSRALRSSSITANDASGSLAGPFHSVHVSLQTSTFIPSFPPMLALSEVQMPSAFVKSFCFQTRSFQCLFFGL